MKNRMVSVRIGALASAALLTLGCHSGEGRANIVEEPALEDLPPPDQKEPVASCAEGDACNDGESPVAATVWQSFPAQTSGLFGGTVDLLFQPDRHFVTRDGTLLGWLAEGILYGVYRSTNGGRFWGNPNLVRINQIHAQAVDGTIYATSISGGLVTSSDGATYISPGLMSSSDDGETWQTLLANILASDLALGSTGEIYAFGHGLFTQSSDTGKTWATPIGAPTEEARLWVDGHGSIRLVDESGLWTYDPVRGFWTRRPLPLETGREFVCGSSNDPMSCAQRASISDVAYLSDGTLLVGTSSTNAPVGILRSDDRGASWERSLELESVSRLVVRDDVIFAAGSRGRREEESAHLIVSRDRGQTWEDFSPPGLHHVPEDLVVFNDGSLLLAPGDGVGNGERFAEYMVREPLPWLATPSSVRQVPSECFDGLAGKGEDGADCGGECEPCTDWGHLDQTRTKVRVIMPSGTAFRTIGTTTQVSKDQGRTWQVRNMAVDVRLERDGVFFGMGPNSDLPELVSSADEGASWKVVGSLPGAYAELLGIVDDTLFVVHDSSVHAAPIASLQWEIVRSFEGAVEPLGQTAMGGLFIRVTTPDMDSNGVETVLRSTDGSEWTALDPPFRVYPPIIESAGGLYAHPFDGPAYASADQGQTWTLVAGTADLEIRSMAFNSGSTLMVSTADEIFVCREGDCVSRSVGICGSSFRGAEASLQVFPNDQVLFGQNCLSVVTTSW